MRDDDVEGFHRGPIAALVVALAMMTVTGCAADTAFPGEGAPTAAADDQPTPGDEGWIALAAGWATADISLVRPGEPAHRIVGADDDGVARVCPAFSADAERIAWGAATGDFEAGWNDATLVIADVTADGEAVGAKELHLDGLTNPPCPIWSPDGRWVAFGAETEGRNAWDAREAVWILDTGTEEILRLTGLATTDIEWAPGSSELYLADRAGVLVYSIAGDAIRTLPDTALVRALTVSPDGGMLAVERRRHNAAERYDLLLMDVDGSDQRVLVADYAQMHGLGPVWSPDGKRVVFQRSCKTYTNAGGTEQICREQHDVVVIPVAAGDPLGPAGTEHVVAAARTPDGDGTRIWFPFAVTWSPDSAALLFCAWAETAEMADGSTFTDGLLSVPVDGSTPAAVLHEDDEGFAVYLAMPMNDFQSWSAP